MLANMDENDLRSLVDYVIDQFTDENGNVDQEKVYELVGSFMNDNWSEAEISEMLEGLSVTDLSKYISDEATLNSWNSLWDSLTSQLSQENVGGWLQNVFSDAMGSDGTSDTGSSGNDLMSLVEGLFGAFGARSGY